MEQFQKQQQHNIDEAAEIEQFQKQQQHNIDEAAEIEQFQKQQQHNIDESAEMEQLNMDYLQSDHKALLERRQQRSALIDQGTSQLIEECQNQQQQNIDALTEGRKGNGGKMAKIGNLVAILARVGQWRRYDLYRIVGTIVLLIFIIYAVNQLNAQKDYRFKMNEQMNEMRLEMAESLKSVQAMVGAELGIDPYRIAGVAGAIVLLIFCIYMAHQLKEQKENRLKMNVKTIVVAELEQQKLSNANKNDNLEQSRKEQLYISYLLKLGLINRWDSDDCHPSLALIGPGRWIVQRNGENSEGWSSVLAESRILENPFGIFYFEVTIVENTGDILIGLAKARMPLDKHVGAHDGNYAYSSYGNFWGHEVAGCLHTDKGRPYSEGKLEFGVGDVIGCGVNLATRQILYTKNGECLDTDGFLVESAVDLAFRWTCLALKLKRILVQTSNSILPMSFRN